MPPESEAPLDSILLISRHNLVSPVHSNPIPPLDRSLSFCMQHQPKSPSVNPEITQNNQQTDPVEGILNDLDDFHLATPSSQLNDRPSRKSPRLSAKKIGKWKVKGKPRLSQDPNGEW